MKAATVVVVFIACMAVAHCLVCQETADCKEGECCVSLTINQIRGNGVCRRLGRLGSPCNMKDITLEKYGDKYLTKCPCKDDYTCEPAARYRNGNGNKILADISQRCRRASTTTKTATTTTRVTPTTTTTTTPTTTTSQTSEVSNEISTESTSTVTGSSTE